MEMVVWKLVIDFRGMREFENLNRRYMKDQDDVHLMKFGYIWLVYSYGDGAIRLDSLRWYLVNDSASS